MLVRALLASLAAVALLVTPSRAAAPLDTIAGNFEGKYRTVIRFFSAEDGPPEVQSNAIGFSLGQEGTSVEGGMALLVDEGPGSYFDVAGNAGNGNFQLLGFEEGSLLALHGTMKGQPGKRSIKGKGSFHSDFGVGEMKFSAKEVAPIE